MYQLQFRNLLMTKQPHVFQIGQATITRMTRLDSLQFYPNEAVPGLESKGADRASRRDDIEDDGFHSRAYAAQCP